MPTTYQQHDVASYPDTGVAQDAPGSPANLDFIDDSEIGQIAASDVTILLGGETGSGKGRFARQLHHQSTRAGGAFVAVDCAALPESLFESQMFGHKKGSFTGATCDRVGLIRSADGGTLFLDEIGELGMEQQAKLLTFIQERTVLPVGGAERVSCDVRLIVATHRDLFAMVQRGEFREDLFYRIAVIELNLPSLRERMHEIPEIVEELIEVKSELLHVESRPPSERFMKQLMEYHWPGNVRELGNVIERALVLSRGECLQEHTLPQRVRGVTTGCRPEPIGARTTPRSVQVALEDCDGNKTEAAKLLGISRRHLYRMIEKIGVEARESRSQQV
tara:strand:+ start:91285 stop:92286 length:1002 start_codon:yes stop_codon:yes gene_type:complete